MSRLNANDIDRIKRNVGSIYASYLGKPGNNQTPDHKKVYMERAIKEALQIEERVDQHLDLMGEMTG
jgi:hypothetical protein